MPKPEAERVVVGLLGRLAKQQQLPILAQLVGGEEGGTVWGYIIIGYRVLRSTLFYKYIGTVYMCIISQHSHPMSEGHAIGVGSQV